MRALYYIFFCAGVVYTLIAFILGGIFDGLDIGGDGGFDGFFSSLKPIIIVSFVTVFGGIGLITINSLPWYLSLLISTVSALILALLINRFIIIPLYKAQNTSSPIKSELIGREASVINTILKNNYGSITYSYKGNTYTSPARNLEEDEIKQGASVVIIKIEDSVFYVMPK